MKQPYEQEFAMNETYLWSRMRASLAMARRAEGSAARLIHLELAGRYSIAATEAAAGRPRIRPRTSGPRVSSFRRDEKDIDAQSPPAIALQS